MDSRSQWYIGSPNGVVVCVDGITEGRLSGSFYCRYYEQMIPFYNTEQLLGRMNGLFDELNFPRATTGMRSFGEQKPIYNEKERTAVMTDKEMLEKHGDLGTFVVRVQHRQHNSWQGRITWMEENKSLYFRSIWEMIKLIESALNISADPEELEEEPKWFSE